MKKKIYEKLANADDPIEICDVITILSSILSFLDGGMKRYIKDKNVINQSCGLLNMVFELFCLSIYAQVYGDDELLKAARKETNTHIVNVGGGNKYGEC